MPASPLHTTTVSISLTVASSGEVCSSEASYVSRFARKLLASRDIMQLNNIRDPQSGMSYYDAVNQLVDFRYQNQEINSIQPIPFFENLFPFMPDGGATTLCRQLRLLMLFWHRVQ